MNHYLRRFHSPLPRIILHKITRVACHSAECEASKDLILNPTRHCACRTRLQEASTLHLVENARIATGEAVYFDLPPLTLCE